MVVSRGVTRHQWYLLEVLEVLGGREQSQPTASNNWQKWVTSYISMAPQSLKHVFIQQLLQNINLFLVKSLVIWLCGKSPLDHLSKCSFCSQRGYVGLGTGTTSFLLKKQSRLPLAFCTLKKALLLSQKVCASSILSYFCPSFLASFCSSFLIFCPSLHFSFSSLALLFLNMLHFSDFIMVAQRISESWIELSQSHKLTVSTVAHSKV